MNNLTELNKLANTINPNIGTRVAPSEQKIQTSFKKAKEAEDASIYPFRPMRQRSYSLSQLDPKQKTEKEECEARSGAFWECIGRKPSKFGGYIYLFKIKDEYNDLTLHPELDTKTNHARKKRAEIFPAIELSAVYSIISYDLTYDIENQIKSRVEYVLDFQLKRLFMLGLSDSEIRDLRKNIESEIRAGITLNARLSIPVRKNAKILWELGYQFSEKNGQVFKEAPDREALLGAYHNLKETHSERDWPDFEISSSEGIADDESYAKAHFIGGLLSTGFEFNHDLDAHIIPRLHRIFEGTAYYQKTERELIHHVFSVYRMIYMAQEQNPRLKQHSEKLNFFLGMASDILFSLTPNLLERLDTAFVSHHIENVWEDRNWKRYVERRFPKNTPTNAEMRALWREVERAANDFVQARSIAKLTEDLASSTMQS